MTDEMSTVTDGEAPPAGSAVAAQPPETIDRVVDLVTLGTATVLATGFLSISMIPAWSPRLAGLLLVLPIGVFLLSRLVRNRDRPTIVLVAALTWAAVTSLFQTAPAIRLLGMLGLESSVLIYLGGASCWALGRNLSELSRRLLPIVVLGALLLNAVIGLAQVILEIRSGPFVLFDDRAHGLTSYSVYFGSLMSAGCVLSAAIRPQVRWQPLQLVGVFTFATASVVSGSRSALGATAVMLIFLAVTRRRWFNALSIGLMVAGTIAGTVLGARLADAPSGDSGTSLQRLGIGSSGGGGGLRWRLDGWRAGFEAWVERPIAGWGVGNFRQAIQTKLGGFQTQGAPRFDAHNILVEWLVTVGVVGLVLFTAFAVLCALQARGVLALGAATIALAWMLQPAGLSTLPLTLLLLGAAMPQLSADSDTDARPMVRAWCLVVGLAVAAAFTVFDLRLNLAADTLDADGLEEAATLYPWDPNLADFVAQGRIDQWSTTQGGERFIEPTLTWSQRAVDRQPDAPTWLDSLASRQISFGQLEDARLNLEHTLELQPGRPESLSLLRVVGQEQGDDELVALAEQQLCDIRASFCDAFNDGDG